jgi:hypothetical protein
MKERMRTLCIEWPLLFNGVDENIGWKKDLRFIDLSINIFI